MFSPHKRTGLVLSRKSNRFILQLVNMRCFGLVRKIDSRARVSSAHALPLRHTQPCVKLAKEQEVFLFLYFLFFLKATLIQKNTATTLESHMLIQNISFFFILGIKPRTSCVLQGALPLNYYFSPFENI